MIATPARLRRSKGKVRRLRKPGFESVLERIDEEVEVEAVDGPTKVTNAAVFGLLSERIEGEVVHSVTKLTNIVRVGFDANCWKLGPSEEKVVANGDFKDAWLWVEGWRARLRAGGDVVERCKYDYDGPG